ncbi:hypothetical protein [Streptomyces nymphaeiformis]|uniref:Uncharacterized protein n=1 Tax=Streptomyces nymphaeiformis TaxID=2663842 RepID=A0A7W7XDZ7_9ACTN|nr:hypothetical protein [Streptomyces nymphaeiformis]MBB4984770.1 hypothetical protein [Streptomyces nymphaeiformis]
MSQQAERPPRGPLGTQGYVVSPGQIKIGDMVGFDGVFFEITDMAGGTAHKALHFRDREPITVSGPLLVFRKIEYTPVLGEMVYSRPSA